MCSTECFDAGLFDIDNEKMELWTALIRYIFIDGLAYLLLID